MTDWFECMRDGDFASAWRISDEILARRAAVPCAHLPRHEQWIWNGERLDGKRVLIRCYHGLGDTIQFIRYATLVKATAAEVIVWGQPPLVPLLNTVSGVDRVLPLHDGVPEVAYDVDVEIMELPHVFRTTVETIPRDIPYIRLPNIHDAQTESPGDTFRVGVVWRAGDWDASRSLAETDLGAFADIPGVELRALQREIPHDAPNDERRAALVLDDARAMQDVDLVISVDSFPAHLAGALGRPVWTLLSAECDWRWMRERDDSPWYPTMKLFRQRRADDWSDVVDRVRGALASTSAHHLHLHSATSQR